MTKKRAIGWYTIFLQKKHTAQDHEGGRVKESRIVNSLGGNKEWEEGNS